MSIVNSPLEPRSSLELQRAFDYPLVIKVDPIEFYAIHDDMIDYAYRLLREELSGQRLYATTFEFGTYGDSALAGVARPARLNSGESTSPVRCAQ